MKLLETSGVFFPSVSYALLCRVKGYGLEFRLSMGCPGSCISHFLGLFPWPQIAKVALNNQTFMTNDIQRNHDKASWKLTISLKNCSIVVKLNVSVNLSISSLQAK